jgi:hypothetical protein
MKQEQEKKEKELKEKLIKQDDINKENNNNNQNNPIGESNQISDNLNPVVEANTQYHIKQKTNVNNISDMLENELKSLRKNQDKLFFNFDTNCKVKSYYYSCI